MSLSIDEKKVLVQQLKFRIKSRSDTSMGCFIKLLEISKLFVL